MLDKRIFKSRTCIQFCLRTEFQFAEHHVPKAVDATGLRRRNVLDGRPADQGMLGTHISLPNSFNDEP